MNTWLNPKYSLTSPSIAAKLPYKSNFYIKLMEVFNMITKGIEGYAGIYKISYDSTVTNVKTGKTIRSRVSDKGYKKN